MRHCSRRTEQAYVSWIRRFIVFHGKRYPRELGEREVTAFVSSQAARGVSASTQNQALSAVLFLFEVVLGQRLAWMNEIVRAQRPARLPVVLSRDEVSSLLSRLRGPVWLMASLMYGAGLRLLECAELRVKDLNFSARSPKHSTRRTWQPDAGASHYRAPSVRSIPTPRVRGPGSGSFRRPGFTSTRRLANGGGITCTNPSCSVRSRMPHGPPTFRGRPRLTRSGIASRLICSRPGTTSERSRNCSGIAT